MVKLIPMSENDYQRFIAGAMDGYAQQQVKTGTWQEENAKELAQKTFDTLLPEGLSSPNQYLYMIEREEDGNRVGRLWWGIQETGGSRFAALNDVQILKKYRRQGYGSEALKAMEKMVRKEGLETILLHVFGHNEAARVMYRKMGYVERNITMMKEL